MEKYLVGDDGELRKNGSVVVTKETQLCRNQGMRRINRIAEEPGERFKKNWQLDIWYDDGGETKSCWKMTLSGLNGGDRFVIDEIGTPEKALCQ